MNIIDAIISSTQKIKEYINKKLTWNELKDRPFGEEPNVTVLETTTVTMDMYMEAFGAFYIQKNIELVEGELYIVTYNGKEYECKCGRLPFDTGEANVMINYVGNSLPLNNVNSGEPFFISDATPVLGGGIGFGSIADSSDSSWEIGIAKKGDINYLDPKYIKDMYYSEEKDVFIYETQETRVGYVTSDNTSPAMFVKLGFEIGKTYKVIWNGTEYECEAFTAVMQGTTGVGVGNRMVLGEENSGEPFIIADVIGEPYGVVIDLMATSMGTATFGIMGNKEVVVKVPKKYLPENLSEFNNDLYGECYELENVIPEGKYFFEKNEHTGLYQNTQAILEELETFMVWSFMEGEQFIVTFDGIEYKLTSVKEQDLTDGDNNDKDDFYAMGNLSLSEHLPNAENTGEPFIVHSFLYDGSWISTELSDSYHTIKIDKIVGTKTKQIPFKYLEMPYGEKIEFIFPEEQIVTDENPFMFSSAIDFEVGKEYIMVFDDVEYPCVAYETLYEGIPFVGIGCKGMLDGTATEFNEPCMIGTASMDGMSITALMLVNFDFIASFTLAVKGGVIYKIPSEYVEPPKDMYYDESKIIFPEQTTSDLLYDIDGWFIFNTLATFKLGQEYIVTYNGVDYCCIAYEYASTYALGDLDNGTEPFMIRPYNTYTILQTEDDVDSITLAIKEINIKKINNKFIDAEWIATYYPSEGAVIFEDLLTNFETANGVNYIDTDKMLWRHRPKAGDNYIIKENDNTYIVEAVDFEGVNGNDWVGLGNLSLCEYGGGKNTGEPFLVVITHNESVEYYTTNDISNGINLVIVKEEQQPSVLPEKFLPELPKNLSYFDNDLYGKQSIEEEVVFEECILEFEKGDLGNRYYYEREKINFVLEEDTEYIVIINGKRYYAFSYGIGENVSMGNKTVKTGDFNNNYKLPFYIDRYYSNPETNMYVYDSECSSLNRNYKIEILKVLNTKIKKINKDFVEHPSMLSEFKNDLYGEQNVVEMVFDEWECDPGNYYNMWHLGGSTSSTSDISYEEFKDMAESKHIVKYDGVEYICDSRLVFCDDNEIIYAIGNSELCIYSRLDTEDDVVTNDPFYILRSYKNSTQIEIHFVDNKTHTVEIRRFSEETEIKKIPKEYIEVDTRPRDYFSLKDIVTGHEYIIVMENGILTSRSKLSGIKVVTPPNKTDYTDNSIFDPTGMIVVAMYEDGAEKEITNYTYDKYVTVGENEFLIRHEEFDTECTTTISITTKTVEEALIDFEYTVNEDGTYTITSWKETLNGEPSTVLQVPNSKLINL